EAYGIAVVIDFARVPRSVFAGVGIDRCVAAAGGIISWRGYVVSWRGYVVSRWGYVIGRRRYLVSRLRLHRHLHVRLHAGFTVRHNNAQGVGRGIVHFWRSDANVRRISAGRVHISRYAPAVGQRVTI